MRVAQFASALQWTIWRTVRRDVRCSDRRLQHRRRALLGDAFAHVDGLVGGHVRAHRVDHEEARLTGAVEPEEAAQLRVVDVDHALVAVLQQRRAVGAEVDRDAVRQDPVALHADAEPRPHRTAVAVGGDHVAGADRVLLVGLEVVQRHRRTIVILLERRRLDAIAYGRAERHRFLAQDRLEHVLVDEHAHRRAESLDALVELLHERGELLAGQRLDRDDPADGVVGLGRRLAHRPLEPDLAQHLRRAELEVSRARVNRSAGMALDDERGDAQIAEQQGARQPDQAPADDQHRCLLLRHVRLLSVRCGDAIRAYRCVTN